MQLSVKRLMRFMVIQTYSFFKRTGRTGFSFDIDSNISTSFGEALLDSGLADDWSHGIDTTATSLS